MVSLLLDDVELRTPKAIKLLLMLAATRVSQGATDTMYTLGTLTKYADYGVSPQRRLINDGNDYSPIHLTINVLCSMK